MPILSNFPGGSGGGGGLALLLFLILPRLLHLEKYISNGQTPTTLLLPNLHSLHGEALCLFVRLAPCRQAAEMVLL